MNKELKTRIMLCISSFALFCFLLAYLYICFLLFWPFNVADFGDLKTDKEQYVAGERVFYSHKFTKHGAYPAQVIRQLRNSHTWTFDDVYSNFPKGKNESRNILVLPKELPSGRYKIIFTAHYRINFIRIETKTAESNFFEVKEKI